MSQTTDETEFGEEIYQSVDENPVPYQAEIVGSVPGWIDGVFIRLGPGKFEWGDSKYNHWFDGEAILNRFEIKDGNVKFSSRFLRSNSYVESEKRGCIAFSHFGTNAPPDPCKNIFSRFFSFFTSPTSAHDDDNCNVNVVTVKGNVYTTADLVKMWKIDLRSLETLQMLDVGIKLAGESRSWTSHPHFGGDGSYFNCSADFDRKVYEIVRIPPSNPEDNRGDEKEGVDVIASIPYDGQCAYMHSFAMTDNYFVLMEGSLLYRNPSKLKQKLMDLTAADLLYFDEKTKSKLHVIDRKSGKVGATYYVEPYMCFHQINAYENTEDEIVFDTCFYPDSSVIDDLYLRPLRSGETKAIFPAEVRRYRLPLKDFNIEQPLAADLKKYAPEAQEFTSIHPSYEMPKINYASYSGKPYKFTYGTGNSEIQSGLTTLIKINLDTKEAIVWEMNNCYPSEPVFIENPNAKGEDDGVVLSAVLGVRGSKSFLLILDAKNMNEIARAYCPKDRLIPLFHSDFFKQSSY
eukprot:gene8891-9841_t